MRREVSKFPKKERRKFGSSANAQQWTYIDEHQSFVPPPPKTQLNFENLWDWDNVKARYCAPWRYPPTVENESGADEPPHTPPDVENYLGQRSLVSVS